VYVRPSVRPSIHPSNQSNPNHTKADARSATDRTYHFRSSNANLKSARTLHPTGPESQYGSAHGPVTVRSRAGKTNILCLLCCAIRTVHFLTFHTSTNKMHLLKHNKTDHKTHHIRCPLLHVSAPQCHLQAVYYKQKTVSHEN